MISRLARRIFDNAYILLSLTSLFWAGNQVLGRAVAGEVPPVTYSFLRWSGAALLILPFAWRHLHADLPEIRKRWVYLAFIGSVGGGFFNTVQYVGLNHTTALNSLVLNSTGPIFIGLACFAIFRDRITLAQILGTVVSMIGVMAIVTKGDPQVLRAFAFNVGDLWILLGMATNGIYTAYLRQRPPIHWISFLFCLFAVSATFVMPWLLWELSTGARMNVSPFTLSAVAYVMVVPSILAYMCFTRGVELVGGVRSAVFLHLIPVFGAALAIGLLGEPLGLYHLAGFALILAGVVMASRKS